MLTTVFSALIQLFTCDLSGLCFEQIRNNYGECVIGPEVRLMGRYSPRTDKLLRAKCDRSVGCSSGKM